MNKRFRGTYTVMVTAFDVDGAIDLDAQAQFTDWQIQVVNSLLPPPWFLLLWLWLWRLVRVGARVGALLGIRHGREFLG